MKTWTGKTVDPLDFKPEDFDIEDVAHSLANICRYGGHCLFYTVAEHCVLLARYARKLPNPGRIPLLILLHDAAEAYLGDIVRPNKEQMPNIEKDEASIMTQIYAAVGIDPPTAEEQQIIQDLDDRIITDECYAIRSDIQNATLNWPHVPLGVNIIRLYPIQAKKAFLELYKELT